MPIQATQLSDLVAMTQRDLGRPNFTEIARDLQKYTAMTTLLMANRVTLTSGYGVQWNVMVNHSGSARNTGLGESDNPRIVDTMVQAQADWRNSTADWTFEAREIDMNRDPARIVDMVAEKRAACMISVAELMENNFWGPPVAIDDNITPWGVNTWIVKNATEGFNGPAPSGYTTIGLNPTTYPRWKNYTAQYVSISKEDLVRKLRTAATKTKFYPIPNANVRTFSTGDKWGYYTNYPVVQGLEEILESQNDNLGNTLDPMDGKTILRNAPVEWVPKLDADSTNPIYGLNWGDFKTHVLAGWWGRETNVPVYPGQHTMSVHFLDYTYQWVMKNRRGSFVIATGTTYPG